MKTIGDKIKELRGEMSLRELEQLSGIDRTTLSKLENNKWTPGLSTLGKIALALGCNVGDFFVEGEVIRPNVALTHIRGLIEGDMKKGNTQKQIAKKTGLDEEDIVKLLKEDISPTLRSIMQFSKAYNISISELTEGGVKELHLPSSHSHTKDEEKYIDLLLHVLRSDRERFKKGIKGFLDDFAEMEEEAHEVKAHSRR